MRKIIHCDCDCFYAAVEMRDDPSLRGRPVAVGGRAETRGVIATCNYEARAFGVHSAMPTARALQLCPQLVLLAPDFERYREASRRILAIYHDYTALVEPLSLDEAYLDVTGVERCRGSASLMAQEIRARIRAEVGITASAGHRAQQVHRQGGERLEQARRPVRGAPAGRRRLRRRAAGEEDLRRRQGHRGQARPAGRTHLRRPARLERGRSHPRVRQLRRQPAPPVPWHRRAPGAARPRAQVARRSRPPTPPTCTTSPPAAPACSRCWRTSTVASSARATARRCTRPSSRCASPISAAPPRSASPARPTRPPGCACSTRRTRARRCRCACSASACASPRRRAANGRRRSCSSSPSAAAKPDPTPTSLIRSSRPR